MKAYFGAPRLAGAQVCVVVATLVLTLGAWPAGGADGDPTPRHRSLTKLLQVSGLSSARLSVPAGFQATDRVFNDTFGGSGYRFQDRWNYGVTDVPGNVGNEDQSKPWAWHVAANGASWTGSDDKLECWIPGQVTQASTGSTTFSSTGSGLRIQARPDTQRACPAEAEKTWVSGAINTFGRPVGPKGNGTFGGPGKVVYLEARMKMPYAIDANGRRIANGTMAAFWTLAGPGSTLPYPNGIDQESVCVQESGMVQPVGANAVRTIAQTTHQPVRDASGTWRRGYQEFRKDTGKDLSAGFHTYGANVNYATNTVTYYVDGVKTSTHTNWQTANPFILIFNMHLLGDSASYWHSTLQKKSGFTQDEMSFGIDWVRVFERNA